MARYWILTRYIAKKVSAWEVEVAQAAENLRQLFLNDQATSEATKYLSEFAPGH